MELVALSFKNASGEQTATVWKQFYEDLALISTQPFYSLLNFAIAVERLYYHFSVLKPRFHFIPTSLDNPVSLWIFPGIARLIR